MRWRKFFWPLSTSLDFFGMHSLLEMLNKKPNNFQTKVLFELYPHVFTIKGWVFKKLAVIELETKEKVFKTDQYVH